MCARISAKMLDRTQQGPRLTHVHRLDKAKRHGHNGFPTVRGEDARVDVGEIEIWLQGGPGLAKSENTKRIKKF